MTVRFVTSWNGYSAGDRATLAGATETALIAGGIARADYVQDNPSPLFPPNANEAAAVVGAGIDRLRAAPARVFRKHSAVLFDITRQETPAGFGISQTNCTNTISNERSRWGAYSRKVTITGSSADFKTRSTGVGAPLNIFIDPAQKAIQFSIYFETNPTEFASPNNPYLTLYISNFWSGGSNQARWTVDIAYLRQGWNLITVRASDVVGATAGLGDMPAGMTRNSDLGTGFDWNASLEFVNFSFTNFDSGTVVHLDQIRSPAEAVPVFVIGFDAIGAFGNDEVMYTKVAPLFAKWGIKSYATLTYVYDLLYAGGAGWQRFAKLQSEYRWDAIPHSWNHGGSALGANLTLTSLVAASDLVTATYTSAHQIPLGRKFRAKISGASIIAANGVFEMTATAVNQVQYTATGAGTATATGTIRINTFMSEVFGTDTAENRRLVAQEWTRNAQAMRSNGFARGVPYIAYPNNSVPHLDVMAAVAAEAGIRLGRASRGGFAYLDELGIDNPLNFGSWIMDSGVTLSTTTSYIKAKAQAALDRGVHCHIFGHFILDDEDPANAAYKPVDPDSPPGVNGNPAPPGGASQAGGGWWYLSQLRRLIEDTVGPAVASGSALAMSPSEYDFYFGGWR